MQGQFYNAELYLPAFFFYSFRGGRISIFPRFFLLTARVRKVRLLKAEHRKGSSSELKTSNMIQLKSRSVFFFLTIGVEKENFSLLAEK